MVSHEENHQSIVDWFLSPPPYTSYPPYNLEIIQDYGCINIQQPEEHYKDHEVAHRSSNVDSDEMIARTLQDDYLPFEVEENNKEYSHSQEGGYSNASATAFVWNDQPTGNYSSEWFGNDNDHDRSDDSVNIYPCSSPSDTEEYRYSWEPTDLNDLDGEVGRRLNQLNSIPHVPKINGEIPSEDEAVTDHERLLNRLETYGFSEVKVQGDGNCQFRALSDQLYNNPERHKQVRREIVNQLKSCRESYEGYVPMDYTEYLKKLSRSGEWGDHVTLQAAADTYRVKILVMTSFKDTCYIEILPKSQDYRRVIFLSFWAEVHYNSIYTERETTKSLSSSSSSPDLQKKKKWWHFGN
ncbi:PREDICTED: uncharacterized protein LOC104816344 [Tarenaya hassleriana]|uniref:uncharacterized protein LOC104816344 n=1 Tax=Tarenaya hassleriana TaxID=28532 RepID=UPI00053C61AE|nr:PREDICTED: uncharacterized protein LOC104816344 [Tarenaya hassleriana]